MIKTDKQVLLRIFLEEGCKYKGRPAYQVLLEYLRTNGFAGATALRGVEGFGRHHKMHSANMLELSTDLPIVVEIVESQELIDKLKDELERTNMVDGALVTEQPVLVHRFIS